MDPSAEANRERMVANVDWKNDGWAGELGIDGGKTPTLTSLANKYAMECVLSGGKLE